VVAGGISLVLLLTPVLLINLIDAGPARLLGFIVWEIPVMFVYYVAGEQAPFWMGGVLAWVLWGLITYALLCVVDIHTRSLSSTHA